MGRLVMRRRLPSLNWLRSFEASARHLSFTGAARELNMTQAGVSQQVKHLEQHLREPLFHRFPRSLQLTDAGEAYLLVVRDSFERLAAGTEEIFGHDSGGPVTIRVNVAFATLWLAPRLKRFLAAHPDLDLRVVASVHAGESDWDGVELEVRYGNGSWPGVRVDRLTWDSLFPVCSPALMRGRHRLERPADLANHRLLHVIGNQKGWAQWLKAAGATEVSTGEGLQFDTSIVALEMASAGLGVALGHSSIVGDYLDKGRLVVPFDLAIPTGGVFFLVAPDHRSVRPEAMIFRDWLVEEARQACPQPGLLSE